MTDLTLMALGIVVGWLTAAPIFGLLVGRAIAIADRLRVQP